MKFFLDLLKRFLKGITYEWILALVAILKSLCKGLKEIFCRPKLPHSEEEEGTKGCAEVSHPSFHRPDPTIYSQTYLMELGLAVTWDNPDISFFRNGVQAPEGALITNTEYEIQATVWNNSFDAPIVGLRVDFSFMSFGVTTTTTPIGSTVVDLGVKGGAKHPAIAKIPWVTPAVGHHCLVVELFWIDDANPRNNVGHNNTNVVEATSPAVFDFTLRNSTEREHAYRMAADTYTLPDRTDCDQVALRKLSKEAKWREIQNLHNRNNFPIPTGWTVEFSPNNVTLAPGQEVVIGVSITPPDTFVGQQPFNVHAIDEQGHFVGGVTVTVTKS